MFLKRFPQKGLFSYQTVKNIILAIFVNQFDPPLLIKHVTVSCSNWRKCVAASSYFSWMSHIFTEPFLIAKKVKIPQLSLSNPPTSMSYNWASITFRILEKRPFLDRSLGTSLCEGRYPYCNVLSASLWGERAV